MPYRVAPPRSDRGSLKDIQNKNSNKLEENPEMPATPQELRIKALYEHALVLRDDALIASLGLIVMDGSPKDPVSLMRHRERVNEIKAKLGTEVAEAQKEIEILVKEEKGPFHDHEMRVAAYKKENTLNTILLEDGVMVKIAGTQHSNPVRALRSFWRAK